MPLPRRGILVFHFRGHVHGVVLNIGRWILGPALAAPLALCGQTAILRAHMDRNAEESAEAPAVLAVLDAKGTSQEFDGFAALLRTEELSPYQIPVHAYSLGSGAAKDLVASYQLLPKAQWLLIDRRTGALVARGERIPEIQTLAADLQKAGFRDRVKDLRAYLKAFPDSLEAHEQLLNQLRLRGERLAQSYMGIQVETRRERLDRGDFAGFMHAEAALETADLSKAKALDPVQDLKAWAAFAQELETVFRNGEWREMNFSWVRNGRPLDAASPTLRALYRRWQPSVEAALQRNPASESFWDVWIWMSRAQGGRPLAPLLAALRPTPFTPDPWPPARAVQALFSLAATQNDWRTLEGLYQSQWDNDSHLLRDAAPNPLDSRARKISGNDVQTALLDQDWTACLAPLLECCLRSGDASQADALFTQALGASRWAALPAKGAELARRCGQPALAERWRPLKPADFR